MKIFFSENPSRILKEKNKVEKKLDVKINIQGKEISIEGDPENEYITEMILEALEFGFPLPAVFSILYEDYLFEKIPIKKYTKRKDLEVIRARIIGTQGKTLRALTELTKCNFQIKNNEIAIIGNPEYMRIAQDSIISIIRGSRQANVYAHLEKHHPEPIIDLGLKPLKSIKKKTKKRSVKKKVRIKKED